MLSVFVLSSFEIIPLYFSEAEVWALMRPSITNSVFLCNSVSIFLFGYSHWVLTPVYAMFLSLCVQKSWRKAAQSTRPCWWGRLKLWGTNSAVLTTVMSSFSTSALCPQRQTVCRDRTNTWCNAWAATENLINCNVKVLKMFLHFFLVLNSLFWCGVLVKQSFLLVLL